MPRVFVTGGSGYLGRNLIRHFKQEGWDVAAIARSDEAKAVVTAAGAEAFPGDINDLEALVSAAAGCQFCVHSAASTAMWVGNYDSIRRINVNGAITVLNACAAAGVGRMCHVSTENTMLCGQPLVDAVESDPYPTSSYGPYSTTKREAEQALLSHESPCELVIVRPRVIWGRDDSTLLAGFAGAMRSGEMKWFGRGANQTSTAHVVNVCHGIELALRKGIHKGIYYLTDGAPIVFKTFLSSYLISAGFPEQQVASIPSIPVWLLWIAAWFGEMFAKFTKRPPLITRGVLATLAVPVTVSDAKARAELGYSPKVSIEEGMREVAARFKEQGRCVVDDPEVMRC